MPRVAMCSLFFTISLSPAPLYFAPFAAAETAEPDVVLTHDPVVRPSCVSRLSHIRFRRSDRPVFNISHRRFDSGASLV